jgi:hypothetical protein
MLESKRKDYTNEIISTRHQTEHSPADTVKNSKKKLRIIRKSVLILIPILIVGAVFLFTHQKSAPIPKNIQSAVNFTLYYPSKLPSGYSIKEDSFSQGSNVVTYYAQNSHNDRLLFSIQPRPVQISLDDFNKRVMQNKVDVLSNVGTASVGNINNKATGSLIAPKSWVLITSSSNAGTKTIADTLANLKSVN